MCVAECPVNAIFADQDVPAAQQAFVEINATLARRWPVITKSKRALPGAEQGAKVQSKIDQLDLRGQNEPD